MPRQNRVYTNFSAGEISPKLVARSDIEKYFQGCKTLENYIVLPGGGTESRPGTHYVAPVKTEANKTRCIPFIFSNSQAYVLELGNLYARVYANNGRVESPPGTPVEFVTPFATADLFNVKFTQNADTVYLFLQGTRTQKITRTSGTSWSITAVEFLNGPYITPQNSDTTITLQSSLSAKQTVIKPSAVANNGSGAIRVTSNGHGYATNDYVYIKEVGGVPNANGAWQITVIDANNFDLNGSTFAGSYTSGGKIVKLSVITSVGFTFTTNHVNTSFRIKASSAWGDVYTRKYISATQMAAEITTALDGVGATSNWMEGLWSGAQGWPSCGTFHEQRLVCGGSTQKPQTVSGSVSADFENFSLGAAAATDSWIYTIGSNQVNNIQWLVSTSKGLQIGTLSQEFVADGGTTGSAITPTAIMIRPHSPHGSNSVAPVRAYSYTLFMQKAGRKLREFKYDLYTDTFISEDLSILSEHITLGGITDMAFQQEPYSALWMVRGDGQLVCMTYNPLNKQYGWSRHITDGLFESVACIPSPDGTYDQVWVIVRRTVNGATRRYVEYFDPNLTVDSGLTYSGAPVTSVSGLTHLETKTVAIVGDGAVYPSQTVASGAVPLDPQAPASNIQVGLQFAPSNTLLRPETPGSADSTQGFPRHWARLWVEIYNTLGLRVNSSDATFRNTTDPMGSEPAPFTGKKYFANLGWDADGNVTITQPLPLKSYVLAAGGILDVGEDE